MKIKINFLGMLPNYTGVDSIDVELADTATYADLLAEIAVHYGDRLPEKCWNTKKCEFRKPISAIGSNGDIDERSTPLAGHKEINFLIPVSGGATSLKGYSKWRQFS